VSCHDRETVWTDSAPELSAQVGVHRSAVTPAMAPAAATDTASDAEPWWRDDQWQWHEQCKVLMSNLTNNNKLQQQQINSVRSNNMLQSL